MKKIAIEVRCQFCGAINQVAVFEADYDRWIDGALVQNAFPYLTADERELLVSGLCLDCQKDVFDSDEDYDEEPDIDLDCGFDPYLGYFTDDC